MTWRTPDDSPTTAEQRAATELHGTPHPDRTDADQLHDDALEDADRAFRHAPLAYVEAPSPRERREHYDETRVANTLRPRTGNVQVQPRLVPCTCGAAARGLRLAGPAHRYGCALYSPRIDQETKAA